MNLEAQMSDFYGGWGLFVSAIVIAGLVYCIAVLFGAARHKVIRDSQGNVQADTGHVWDGDLRELNNPLPRWWLVLFVITVVFSCVYLYLYPGLGERKGSLGWSAVGQLQDEVKKAKASEDQVYAKFKTASVEDIARDPQARAIGERLFLNNCAACHGSDARGAKSFPNLTDKDWLHGGSPEQITQTLVEGRRGQMPPMAAAVGSGEEVRQVANYVLSLSGSAHNPLLAQLGKDKFKAACAACHGAEGKGNHAVGAPNLTDKVWLHGWGEQAVIEMINKGKLNVMPAQKDRYSPEQIKVLTAYVWGLSNGVQTADAKTAETTAK
jgi:cytochrome c oxidase cbb3-type subunit III